MIDRYTKAVLTVIAVCLCLITAQNFNIVPSATSGKEIQKVQICDFEGACAYTRAGALHVIPTQLKKRWRLNEKRLLQLRCLLLRLH